MFCYQTQDKDKDKDKDCFICCTKHGLTDRELLVNPNAWHYPQITLAQAYGCKCVHTVAHNRCLQRANNSGSGHRCPTCRATPTMQVENQLCVPHSVAPINDLVQYTIRHRVTYTHVTMCLLVMALTLGLLYNNSSPWYVWMLGLRLLVLLSLMCLLQWSEYIRTRWLINPMAY
jgi:hypothetical protein